MKGLRQATVEPVLGTLINFRGLRKINTRGIRQAHKGMLLAATAYNLQKLLRSRIKRRQSAIMALPRPLATTLFLLFYRQQLKLTLKRSTTSCG
jgi:hypothetical protein